MAVTELTFLQGTSVVDLALTPSEESSVLTEFSDQGLTTACTIREAWNGWKTYSIVLSIPDGRKISDVLTPISLEKSPLVYVRMGVISATTAYWRQWEPMWLTAYHVEPNVVDQQQTIRIECADLLYSLVRRQKTSTRKGSISDIVTNILTENNFKNLVVEPTVGKGAWIQSFTSDFDFITQKLLKRAINASGSGNYKLFTKDSKVYFCTVDYTVDDTPINLLDYETTENRQIDLHLNDVSRIKHHVGSAGVRVVCANPYDRNAHQLSDASKSLKFAKYQADVAEMATFNQPFHVSDNTVQELAWIAQNVYASQRQDMYQIGVTLVQCPTIRVGDLVKLSVNQTPWAGFYAVSQLAHTIVQGSLSSRVIMVRGEVADKSDAISRYKVIDVNADTRRQHALQSDSEAKGVQPRLVIRDNSKEGSNYVPVIPI